MTGPERRSYKNLFSNGEFCAFYTTQSLANLSAAASSLALGSLAYRDTSSATLVAISLFAGPIVKLFCSMFMLSLSDRIGARNGVAIAISSWVVCDLGQAMVEMPLWARFLLLLFPWVVASATAGSTWLVLHQIVPEGLYALGRSTVNVSVGLSQFVGFGVGASLIALLGPRGLFGVAGIADLLALLGTVLLISNRRPPPKAAGSIVAATAAGHRILFRSRSTRSTIGLLWLPGLIGGVEALFIPHAGSDAGYLFAGSAVGMIIGDVTIGRFVPKLRTSGPIIALCTLAASSYLLALTDPPTWVLSLAAALAAFGCSAGLPLQERLIELVPEGQRGQALGLATTGLLAVQSIFALLVGATAEVLPPHIVMGGTSVLAIVYCGIASRSFAFGHVADRPVGTGGAS